jgi:hypothetical protein
MTKGLFQIDPFPDPTHAGQEIENVGLMFAFFLMFIVFMVLMVYCYQRLRKPLPIIVIYLNSLWASMLSLGSQQFPFTPQFQVFFMLFQSSLFLIFALEYSTQKKRKTGR